MEIRMTSSSSKPASAAMRLAVCSALSTVSSVESNVKETRCSVMIKRYAALTLRRPHQREAKVPLGSESDSVHFACGKVNAELREGPKTAKFARFVSLREM